MAQKMTLDEVIAHLTAARVKYPEMGNQLVGVEHEDGIIDTCYLTEVSLPGTGRVHLIIEEVVRD
jgi:hypothetical protein